MPTWLQDNSWMGPTRSFGIPRASKTRPGGSQISVSQITAQLLCSNNWDPWRVQDGSWKARSNWTAIARDGTGKGQQKCVVVVFFDLCYDCLWLFMRLCRACRALTIFWDQRFLKPKIRAYTWLMCSLYWPRYSPGMTCTTSLQLISARRYIAAWCTPTWVSFSYWSGDWSGNQSGDQSGNPWKIWNLGWGLQSDCTSRSCNMSSNIQ